MAAQRGDASHLTRPSGAPTGKPPTILQVIPALVGGGAERGCIDVAKAVIEAGGRALVVSNGGPLVGELEAAGATHIPHPVQRKMPWSIWANARFLARLIAREKVDLIHARSRAPAWSAYWAARRAHIPFVTTFHAAYGFKGKLKKRYNSVMARGDRVIAISRYIARHVRRHYQVGPDRLRVIARGIDMEMFNRPAILPVRLMRLAEQWRLPPEAPLILMPARPTRIKGHAVLIEAIARLGRRDIRCLMVGGGAEASPRYRAELEALIAARRLEGIVHLLPSCPDLPAAYAMANVVVAPSIAPEGFGRVPVEAQAMGCPVIASKLGGFAETIAAGETGWLFPPGDVEALAIALKEALALSDEQRRWLGQAARAHVRERFTVQAMCDATLDAYEELLHPEAEAAGMGI